MACDVRVGFVDAATFFARQKGATDGQIHELQTAPGRTRRRVRSTGSASTYATCPAAGAAGGLAGGLAALGATLRPGFELVAAQIDLDRRARAADLVLTGEGRLDATSVQGKVTGAVVTLCDRLGVPVHVVAGTVAEVPRWRRWPPARWICRPSSGWTARSMTFWPA